MVSNAIIVTCILMIIVILCSSVLYVIYSRDQDACLYATKSSISIADLVLTGNASRMFSKLKNTPNIPMYYINMKKSKDRDIFIQEQAKILGVTLTRIDAIDGRKVPDDSEYIYSDRISKSELGCTLSHLRAIKTAYENGNEAALIMEDDINILLSCMWNDDLYTICEQAHGWNTINMAPIVKDNTVKFKPFDGKNPAWGCGAYLITREGMKNILYLTRNGIDLSVESGHNQVADYIIYNNTNVSYEYNGEDMFYTSNFILDSTIADDNRGQVQMVNNAYNSLVYYGLIDLKTIPKNIYTIVSDKHNIHKSIKDNIKHTRNLNPAWVLKIFDYSDIEDYISRFHPGRIYNSYNSINPEYGAGKADFFRYILMYDMGGVYMDDKSGSRKPLDDIILESDQYILTHWEENEWSEELGNDRGEFQQWHIICKPKHPFLKAVIDSVLKNIDEYSVCKDGVGSKLLQITGPVMYTKAIIPLLPYYYHRIIDTHNQAGLVYNNTGSGYDHRNKDGKTHYTLLKTPIIKKTNNITDITDIL
jgi:GR25 family glycosyltransferase involved in LPS biosynthesis